MAEFGLPFKGVKLPEFVHLPLLAAMVAAQNIAFGAHLELGAAMRALVEHPVKALRPLFEFAVYALFLLPGVVVILEGLNYPVIDFIYGKLPQLICGD